MVQNTKHVKISTIYLTQEVPTGWILEPNRARASQCDLRVGSVFPKENLGWQELARKSAKRGLEMTVDPMTVERDMLK